MAGLSSRVPISSSDVRASDLRPEVLTLTWRNIYMSYDFVAARGRSGVDLGPRPRPASMNEMTARVVEVVRWYRYMPLRLTSYVRSGTER